ncbi:MAG: ATP cone domain-containing protein, partial [Perlucidibaca sp.]
MQTDIFAEAGTATPPTADNLQGTAPGQLRVIKRNGTVVGYDDSKIALAISKAFLAIEGSAAASSSRIHETVAQLTTMVSGTFKRRMPTGGMVHIEEIQDQVELALMRSGEHKIARAYVLYRNERARARDVETPAVKHHPTLHVLKADGSRELLDLGRLEALVTNACEGLSGVEPTAIVEDTLRNLYDGAREADINNVLVMCARVLIEQEPNYTYVTSRLLMDHLRAEALGFLGIAESATQGDMAQRYPQTLPVYIERGVELELLDPALKGYDLARLGAALKPERDFQFTYLGLQTLYDRYFLHSNDVRFELPQVFFMRVAMGLALGETGDREARAIEFYDLMSTFDYMASTPTLF